MSTPKKSSTPSTTSTVKSDNGKNKTKLRTKKGERDTNRKATHNEVSNKKSKSSTEGSLIPKNMRVLGLTTSQSEVVIRIITNDKSIDYIIPVIDLTFGDKKSLAEACTKSGFYDLADRLVLKRLAAEILQLVINQKVIILSNNGLNKIDIEGDVFSAYVWGRNVYWLGKKPDLKVIVANKQKIVEPSCTNQKWYENVGKYAHKNPYIIFTLCHALSSVLRRMFNQPRPSVALIGKSSIGKSTIQQLCQSATGPIGDVISMSGTKAGIIKHLLNLSDSAAYFQDVRQNDNTDNLIDILFDAADGAGRMKANEELIKITATMLLSNERLLVDMVRGKSVQVDEGIYARYFELVCDAPYGAFHNLHEFDDPGKFADNLKINCEQYYGAVWPALLLKLSKNWSGVMDQYEQVLPKVKAAIAKRAGDGDHGRVTHRILDALAFSAWVGILACRFKVFPLKEIEIINSFGLVMREYVSRQASGTTPLADELVCDVRGYLDESFGRFPPLSAFTDENQRSGVSGYRWKAKKHGELFLFLPHVFDKLFKEKYGGIAYGIVEEAGFLVKTAGQGHRYQVRIPKVDQPKSFIAIKADIRYDKEE